MASDKPPGFVSVLAGIGGAAAAVWAWYVTWLCFRGGDVWPFGFHVGPSVGLGLVMLIAGWEIAATVVWWATLLVLLPLAAVGRVGRGQKAKRQEFVPVTRPPANMDAIRRSAPRASRGRGGHFSG